MAKLLKTIYEHGVFRPLEPVVLEEHQEVTLSVTEGIAQPFKKAPERNCFELAQDLGLVGTVTDAPVDLSTNKVHFESFGRE